MVTHSKSLLAWLKHFEDYNLPMLHLTPERAVLADNPKTVKRRKVQKKKKSFCRKRLYCHYRSMIKMKSRRNPKSPLAIQLHLRWYGQMLFVLTKET